MVLFNAPKALRSKAEGCLVSVTFTLLGPRCQFPHHVSQVSAALAPLSVSSTRGLWCMYREHQNLRPSLTVELMGVSFRGIAKLRVYVLTLKFLYCVWALGVVDMLNFGESSDCDARFQ